jgi:hypothetical protein
MNKLEHAMRIMIQASDEERREAEYRFVEILTFSSWSDIIHMFDTVPERDIIELPVWARNLAFRLACLQQPNNPEILRRAANDLLLFGPDWDQIAEDLELRACAIEEKGDNAGKCS